MIFGAKIQIVNFLLLDFCKLFTTLLSKIGGKFKFVYVSTCQSWREILMCLRFNFSKLAGSSNVIIFQLFKISGKFKFVNVSIFQNMRKIQICLRFNFSKLAGNSNLFTFKKTT